METNDSDHLLMPEKNQSLLDFRPKYLARSNDPRTSKEAARSVRIFAGSHHAKILTALFQQGPGTFYEIASNANLEPSSVWRRLNELERKGLIETTGEERQGPTGRLCRVWRKK